MRPQSQLKANNSSGFLWVWLLRLWTVCVQPVWLFLFMCVCFLEDMVVAAVSLYVYGPTELLLGHVLDSCSGFSLRNMSALQLGVINSRSYQRCLKVLLSMAFSVFSVCCLCFCHLMAQSVQHCGGGLCGSVCVFQ